MLLYVRALIATNNVAKLEELLKDPDLGSKSKVDMLMLRTALNLYSDQGKWEDVHSECFNLLKGACANEEGAVVDLSGADWMVWVHYADAVLQLKNIK